MKNKGLIFVLSAPALLLALVLCVQPPRLAKGIPVDTVVAMPANLIMLDTPEINATDRRLLKKKREANRVIATIRQQAATNQHEASQLQQAISEIQDSSINTAALDTVTDTPKVSHTIAGRAIWQIRSALAFRHSDKLSLWQKIGRFFHRF